MIATTTTRRGDVSRWCCAAAALFLSLMNAPAAQTNRGGAIGLLALPELTGDAECAKPEQPAPEIPLYAQPRAVDIVGWIRAEKHSEVPEGCYWVTLKFHRRTGGSATELPTQEYEEERPGAAVVLETRGQWFKLKLNDGAGWVEASNPQRYFPLEALLTGHPAHLTNAWDGRLAATPGGTGHRPPADPRRRMIGYVVPVLESRRVVLQPGEDAEEVRKRYGVNSMGSSTQPDGTRILDLEVGVSVDGFERPDRSSAVRAWIRTGTVNASLRTTSRFPSEVAVFARRPGWLQVAVNKGDWKDEPRVWIEEGPAWRFHALATAAEQDAFEDDVFGRESPDVHFLESRAVGGRLWLRVEVLSYPTGDRDDPSQVVATGWVPAHDRDGEPVVWFSTRD